jgi:hypothetical protein
MESPNQFSPGLINPKTKAPFTEDEINALFLHLRQELLSAAATFLHQEAELDLPDWMALKDAADDLAGLCVRDSLELALANLDEPDADAEAAENLQPFHGWLDQNGFNVDGKIVTPRDSATTAQEVA